MKRALPFAIAGLMVISTTASAGGYLGAALGTEPSINDGLHSVAKPFGRSARGLAGIRFGHLSLEGALDGFNVLTQRGNQTVYQGSVALKLNLPIGNNFEGFARGGVERTWLSLDDSKFDFSGNGYQIGAGIEYRLNAILADASIFLDYSFHSATLDNTGGHIDTSSGMWGLGLTVGI
ncbi:MAG TPA: outer membrane beta-barrel protein [Kofleriaceae bacterium]|jgi:hypothetical protein|nr:outer membrane beta-barrel protein [Kofleriaceae bacterium]